MPLPDLPLCPLQTQMEARLPPPVLPLCALWRFLLDMMCAKQVKDVRLWSYPYEFGFMWGSLCYRTPFVWGRKKEWIPMEVPEPLHPELVHQVSCVRGQEWAMWAQLCKDTEAQDQGVDARLWLYPMEYKFQEGSWWERDHSHVREWRRVPTGPRASNL